MEVDGTGSGSCPMVGFGIIGVNLQVLLPEINYYSKYRVNT
jgi:hypothetical protein